MKFQLNISNGVGQVEARHGSNIVGFAGDDFHVEYLSAVVVHPSNHNQRQLIAFFADGLNDIVVSEVMLPLAGMNFADGLGWRKPMPFGLTLQGVLIGGEGLGFAENPEACFAWPVKAGHKQVKVYGESVHGHHFVGFAPGYFGQYFAQMLVVAYPWPAGLCMAFNAEIGPVVQLLKN